jgi:amino acid transporter
MPAQETGRLHRVMGFRDVLLFLVTAGVNLQWVATAAAAGPSVMTVWFIGLLAMALPLAWCVIHLASRYPEEGGLYVWTKHAFGDFGAFMCGWTYWMSNLPYFPGVLYFAAGSAVFLGGERFRSLSSSPVYFIVFSLAGLALATWLNLVGLGVARRLNNLGAHARWMGGILLIATGSLAWWTFGSATVFSRAAVTPSLDFKDLIFWSTIAFAFTGLESASFMGGEIHDPRRTVPRALVVAVPIIFAIYFFGTAAVLVALPTGEVSGLQGVIEGVSAMGHRLGLPLLIPIMAALLLMHSLGSVGAWLGAVARIPYVAGIDRFLPRDFGRLHPRWGTPHVAILTQALVTVVFIVLGQAGTSVKGAYEVLVSLVVIIYMVPFLYLFGAAVRLQFGGAPAREGSRGVTTAGHRMVTVACGGLGFLTTLAALILAFFPAADEPDKPLAVFKIAAGTLLMAGSGVVVYVLRRRRARPDGAEGTTGPVSGDLDRLLDDREA